MMTRVIIYRVYAFKQTFGFLSVVEGINKILELHTLELPWKGNQRKVSCIPEGRYKAIKHNSPTFDNCLWIQDVPQRSEILIHAGNYVASPNPNTGKGDLRGCIAPGTAHRDITGDGYNEVVNSNKALDKLLNNVPNEFELLIVGLNQIPQ